RGRWIVKTAPRPGGLSAKMKPPFYTTQKPGEGTGLGLSTAYGIIKQTGGFIFADSPPGRGAVFTIHLPRHSGAEEAASSGGPAEGRIALSAEDEPMEDLRALPSPDAPSPDGASPDAPFSDARSPADAAAPVVVDAPADPPRRNLAAAPAAEAPTRPAPPPEAAQEPGASPGVVLLVEDETPVRSFAARALGLRGWEVIEAESAEAALEHMGDPDLVIDAVVSDVVMPGMDGPSWVRLARESRPALAVVFVSGYAEDVFRRHLGDLGHFEFLPKPYTLGALDSAIRAARDAAPPAPPAEPAVARPAPEADASAQALPATTS
ncbi:MAG: response regulator, partial [Pseudomonadota bacterium]